MTQTDSRRIVCWPSGRAFAGLWWMSEGTREEEKQKQHEGLSHAEAQRPTKPKAPP